MLITSPTQQQKSTNKPKNQKKYPNPFDTANIQRQNPFVKFFNNKFELIYQTI